MDKETTFHYTYSASQNKEVQAIRNKYLPKEESKLEKLRRLDNSVKMTSSIISLCIGIVGCLIFGVGMCMGLGVFGGFTVLCILPGVVGLALMISAFPTCKLVESKKKAEVAPAILKLSEEIMNEKSN